MERPAIDEAGRAELHVTEEVVETYAALTTDRNPLHVDGAFAVRTPFGGRIAHGMLTAGVVSAAITDLPAPLLYVEQDLAFERPVHLDETVEATATVIEHRGDERLRVETEAATGAGTVLTGEALLAVLRVD